MSARGRLALAIWLVALAACLAVIAQTRFVADLSAFMPKAPTVRQQMLVEQLRNGAIARLIMIGIEGGDAAERARLSRELAARLRADTRFVGVLNGEAATLEHDRRYFFDNRYLLSPAVTAERFSSAGLRTAIGNSLADLSGDAGWLVKRLLPRDPTGETLQIMDQFAGTTQPRDKDGVWASHDGKRALLLTQIRESGLNTDAQARAIDAIRGAFAGIPHREAGTRLVMSGTSVLSVASRDTIESEISRLATASIVLVVTLLLIVYRSITLLALGLLPVISGALAGIAAVSLGFGHVHALTLGFGTTLIGETVDYSIYLFVQRTGGSYPRGFWRTIGLGVLTSITGFAALLSSSFPGLSQLGLYSICGLIAAVSVTRFVLPVLVPRGVALRDLTRVGLRLDGVFARLARWRWVVVLSLPLALGIIADHHGDIWNRQLSALSPIPKAQQQLDLALRSDMGGTNIRYMASFTAPDQEAALQKAERVGTTLQELMRRKVIGSYDSPAFVLPSDAAQRARQAALPDAHQAQVRLAAALAGMPLRPERLEGFVTDLQAARQHPPLTRADLAGTSAAFLIDSMLVKRKHDYLVLMPLRATGTGPAGDTVDLERVRSAFDVHGQKDVAVVDLLEETTNVFDSYLHEALILSGTGCLAIVALLLAALRSVSRTLKVIAPLACAVLWVTAALVASGTLMTILHLLGLLLVVAVGSNYALFFDNAARPESAADRRQTQVSLVVANLTTVGSFGLLGFSSVPVLAAVGVTVGPGAFLALIFSAILAWAGPGSRPRQNHIAPGS
jgi:predicted exporter